MTIPLFLPGKTDVFASLNHQKSIQIPVKLQFLPVLPSGYVKIAIENGPVEIVDFPMKNGDFPIKNGDFPIKNGDFPWFFVNVDQRDPPADRTARFGHRLLGSGGAPFRPAATGGPRRPTGRRAFFSSPWTCHVINGGYPLVN